MIENKTKGDTISQLAGFYKKRFGYSHSHVQEPLGKEVKAIIVKIVLIILSHGL